MLFNVNIRSFLEVIFFPPIDPGEKGEMLSGYLATVKGSVLRPNNTEGEWIV